MTATSSEPDSADFAALGAPKSLAAALTEREYKQPTPVQARVLGAADADLLVSSQTGSGKTVAFGLVIGKKLLGETDTFEQKDKARALVVAPTRELAAQVQRELGWLFGRTSARIVSFTGGTDLRLDARNLKRGVDIAVGTPGRLVDLIDRKALDLSGIEVVVLDEADEMLDLGFREGLETILQATPETRRTLLFSATLPPGIRTLARKFQKDALALDPRGAAGNSPKAHEDITHVAHLCADGDRLAALVNVLRLADDDRAIVFCRTRENVSELHTQLTARGFAATAISGDRAQEDRTRALEALRRGKVRVLVATNVAARGLDLPDVGLVVHADLPENAEALTHRSGRTGRAGNKGINTFIVEMSARRRAERLFRDAHLKLSWTAPPDAAAVTAHDRANLVTALTEAIGQPQPDDMTTLAEQLLGDHDAVAVVAVLMDRALAGRPAGEPLKSVKLEHASAASPSRGGGASAGFVLFEVNLGSADSADAKWILPLVCRRGGITRREVGAIRIARDRTYVEVAARAAADFAANAAERDPRAPKVVIGPSRDALPGKSAVGPARPARSQGDRPAPRTTTTARTTATKSTPSEGKPARTEHKPVPSEPIDLQNDENETMSNEESQTSAPVSAPEPIVAKPAPAPVAMPTGPLMSEDAPVVIPARGGDRPVTRTQAAAAASKTTFGTKRASERVHERTTERTSYGKPAPRGPSSGAPERTSYGKPAPRGPSSGAPERTSYGKPAPRGPSSGAPERTSYGKPASRGPSSGAPERTSYGKPASRGPSSGAPERTSYGKPASRGPSSGAPERTSYGKPHSSGPSERGSYGNKPAPRGPSSGPGERSSYGKPSSGPGERGSYGKPASRAPSSGPGERGSYGKPASRAPSSGPSERGAYGSKPASRAPSERGSYGKPAPRGTSAGASERGSYGSKPASRGPGSSAPARGPSAGGGRPPARSHAGPPSRGAFGDRGGGGERPPTRGGHRPPPGKGRPAR